MHNKKDLILERFFSDREPSFEEYYAFRNTHWEETGAMWVCQRSEAMAVELAGISISRGPRDAKEALQMAINDVLSDGRNLVVKEDGVIGPETLKVLDRVMRETPHVEKQIISMMRTL